MLSNLDWSKILWFGKELTATTTVSESIYQDQTEHSL